MAKAEKALSPATMDSIIELAGTMLTVHGYNGVSFLSLGRQLGIGHSNIHYYFKTKDDLVERVLGHYTNSALEFFRVLWRDPEIDLRSKMQRTRDWLHGNFRKYSSGQSGGRIGLLGSMAADVEHLSANARNILRDINVSLGDHIRAGIDIAVDRGDLNESAPRQELALQILWLLYSSRIIVRHGNTFDNLDGLFNWTTDVMELAYGNPSAAGRRTAPRARRLKPARKVKPAYAGRV